MFDLKPATLGDRQTTIILRGAKLYETGARTLQAGRALTGSLTELPAGVPFFATESPALMICSTHSPLDLPEFQIWARREMTLIQNKAEIHKKPRRMCKPDLAIG